MSLVSLCLDWLTSLNFRVAGKFVNAGRMNKSEPTLSDSNDKVISSSFNSLSFFQTILHCILDICYQSSIVLHYVSQVCSLFQGFIVETEGS